MTKKTHASERRLTCNIKQKKTKKRVETQLRRMNKIISLN